MTKRSTVFSIAVIVIGIVLMTVSLVSCGFDFKSLDSKDYVTNTHEITESFSGISIVSDNADITIVPTDSENASVVAFDRKKMTHEVSVKNGDLTIEIDDERKWYDHVNLFSFSTPAITVYLPLSEYGALSIDTDTGDVTIEKGFTFGGIDIKLSTGDVRCHSSSSDFIKIDADTSDVFVSDISAKDVSISISTGDVDLNRCTFASINSRTSTGDQSASALSIENDFTVEVSTGDTNIEDVDCKSFTSIGSTGEISLKNVTATETLSIERRSGDVDLECCTAGYLSVKTSTGDVEFDRSDAGEIYAKTSTGDVEGTLLTSKIFITSTNTGKIRVPSSTEGGKCEITTDTGDIEITVP